jgi:hypothetical protein
VLQGLRRVSQGLVGRLRTLRPPMAAGLESPLSEPALVELCLQAAAAWQIGRTGVLALPGSIQSLRLYPQKALTEPILAEVTPVLAQDGGLSFDSRVVDARGWVCLELKGYTTSQLPYSVEPELLRPFQELVA